MLFTFFLKKFYRNFILIFLALVLILAASDLFVRLPIISSIKLLPKIFLLMFPLMSQFAIPLASCLAVQFTIGNLYVEDEIVLIYYFSGIKLLLHKVILFFSLSILIFYIPIITTWAPTTYKKGKVLILELAKKHFTNLKPNSFHNISDNFSLFFKDKKQVQDKTLFFKVLLYFKEKGKNNFIINSKKGVLIKDTLYLQDGVIQNLTLNDNYIVNFDKTKIELEKFLDFGTNKLNLKDLKFFTLKELKKIKETSLMAYIEYHKRIAQIIWQFFLPFLSLFLIMLFSKRKSNLLISIFISGALFMISYISLNLIKTLSFLGPIVIILFYLPIIFIFLFSFLFYINKV